MNNSQNNFNSETKWRDEAINESLRGFDCGENMDALMYAIRRAQPNYATKILWINRSQAVSFLRRQEEFRPLLTAHNDSQHGEVDGPFLGWYGVQWEGASLEVALVPGHDNSQTICMGCDVECLQRFTAALREFCLRPSGRCLRYSQGWENAPEMDLEIGKVTWDDIVLPADTMKRMRAAIEGFFQHRETVRDFGFAWRRGVLLVGPPGTGKTMVCKAAAAALPDLPFLYVRDLREDEEKESIQAIFERARLLSPCLLAFEDLDGFITPENRTVFLNEMDGFASNDGLMVIASSNHPGKIDEALLKRPSRFDRVFHLALPAHDERRAFCERVLALPSLAQRLAPDLNAGDLAQRVAAKSDGFTPAYLKEAFVSAALERAQEGATVLDETFARAVVGQVEELRAHLKRLKNPEALAAMNGIDDIIGLRR